MMWPLLLLTGLINIILGSVVFRNVKRVVDKTVFLTMEIAVALWAWCISFFIVTTSLPYAQFFANAYYIAAIMIASSVLAFAINNARIKLGAWLWVCYIPVAIWLALLIGDQLALVQVVQATGPLSSRVHIHAFVYLAYSATFVLMYGVALYIMFKDLFQKSGKERKRRTVIIHGLTLSGACGVIFNLLLPGLGIYDYIEIGPLFSIIFASSATYSIVKYSLFDLRQTFLVSFAYMSSLITVATFYGMTIFVVSVVLNDAIQDPSIANLLNIGVAMLAAVLLGPVKKMFDTITDKVFFRHAYNPQDALDELGAFITHYKDIDDLLGSTLNVIDTYLKPNFAMLTIAGGDDTKPIHKTVGVMTLDVNLRAAKQITDHESLAVVEQYEDAHDTTLAYFKGGGVAVVVRLKMPGHAFGYLLLGEKHSGSVYSRKDIDLISVIVDELTVAIENAQRYEEIRRFSRTLQDKVDGATTQLRASNQKLKKLDEAKDEFISMASHQLRTPLTSIKGYISMLLEGDLGELTTQQRDALEEAYDSSQRMVYLIGDFLNLSRLQTGKFEIELSAVSLPQIIKEEIAQLRASAESRGIALHYDSPEGFPLVMVDETKIRQVMMNFIDNAIYYSKATDGEITVSLVHRRDAVTFSVVDNGIGVPAKDRHRLFTKFYRTANARKARPDGTGIGLYMARKVIVAHGGAIQFESKEGVGSTFGFTLPIDASKRKTP